MNVCPDCLRLYPLGSSSRVLKTIKGKQYHFPHNCIGSAKKKKGKK